MLLTWGRAKNFRLGRPGTSVDVRTAEAVPRFSGVEVRQAACGGGHTCVVSADRQLFVFGYSQYGQLGLGDRQDVCHPTQLRLPGGQVREERGEAGGAQEVLQVACGRYHTLALTAAGDVYSWGGGKNGRLGHGDEKIRTLPTRVESLPSRATSVACGYHSSLVIVASENGQGAGLYSWGWGAHGQLGQGDTADRMLPTRIDWKPQSSSGQSEQVVTMACGDRHSFVITESGRVFGWGSNEFGQLGTGHVGGILASPTQISGLDGLCVQAISSGDRHSACVTNLGSVYTWGCGSDGQCGHGNFRNTARPSIVDALSAVRIGQVVCGHNFTLAMSEQFEVYSWGNDAYGQLGLGGSVPVCTPLKINLASHLRPRGISCAHFHCVLWAHQITSQDNSEDESQAVSAPGTARERIVEHARNLSALVESVEKSLQASDRPN